MIGPIEIDLGHKLGIDRQVQVVRETEVSIVIFLLEIGSSKTFLNEADEPLQARTVLLGNLSQGLQLLFHEQADLIVTSKLDQLAQLGFWRLKVLEFLFRRGKSVVAEGYDMTVEVP